MRIIEIERHGEYVCDVIFNPNLRAHEHVIELKSKNMQKKQEQPKSNILTIKNM